MFNKIYFCQSTKNVNITLIMLHERCYLVYNKNTLYTNSDAFSLNDVYLNILEELHFFVNL